MNLGRCARYPPGSLAHQVDTVDHIPPRRSAGLLRKLLLAAGIAPFLAIGLYLLGYVAGSAWLRSHYRSASDPSGFLTHAWFQAYRPVMWWTADGRRGWDRDLQQRGTYRVITVGENHMGRALLTVELDGEVFTDLRMQENWGKSVSAWTNRIKPGDTVQATINIYLSSPGYYPDLDELGCVMEYEIMVDGYVNSAYVASDNYAGY